MPHGPRMIAVDVVGRYPASRQGNPRTYRTGDYDETGELILQPYRPRTDWPTSGGKTTSDRKTWGKAGIMGPQSGAQGSVAYRACSEPDSGDSENHEPCLEKLIYARSGIGACATPSMSCHPQNHVAFSHNRFTARVFSLSQRRPLDHPDSLLRNDADPTPPFSSHRCGE